MTEQWHDIDEQYQVSTRLRVRRRKRCRWLYMRPTMYLGYYLNMGQPVYCSKEVLHSYLPAPPDPPPTFKEILAANARDNANPEHLPDIGKRTYSRQAVRIPRVGNTRPRADMRKCTTCGKPTMQWRCPACWLEVNARNGIDESMGHPGDEYRIPW